MAAPGWTGFTKSFDELHEHVQSSRSRQTHTGDAGARLSARPVRIILRFVQENVTLVARLLVVLLAATLVVTPAARSSCADVLEWRGVVYEGVADLATPPLGERLREPAFDACETDVGVVHRTPGCQGREATTEAESDAPRELSSPVFRIRGVDPAIAIALRSDGTRAYLAPGYFIRLRSHPLHEAMYGRRSDDRPTDGYRRWSCGRPLKIAGTVMRASAWDLRMRFAGDQIRHDSTGENHVAVDVRTTLSGRIRNGLPYVEQGSRVVARVRECTSRGRYGVVADEIQVEAP